MKIAFIVTLFPCLSETFILNQITGLIDRGHDVDIYAYGSENEKQIHADISKYKLSDRIYYYKNVMPENKLLRFKKATELAVKNINKDPGALLNSLNIFRFGREAASLSIFYKIIPFLNKGHYDIIHCQFGPNGDLGVLLKLIGVTKGKVITTFHGYDIRLGLKKGGNVYQRLFEKGDLFLAISSYNYKNLMKFGLDEKKIVFHPVGIDLKKFSYKWKNESTVDETHIKVITVARLVEEKGLQYGIKAIHKVLQKRPELNLEYNIIGSGPLEGELTELIRKLNLSKVVHLRGPKDQNQVIEAIKQSHIFILPSIAEALPVVLMEAQAVGLPVIASAVGSVDQIVSNGISGFCVPPRDPDAFADKLNFLIDHPDVWPDMGGSGRRNVEDNFDIDRLNDRLVSIYQKALN